MQYVLGVDGGASKTHALVVDETGRVLGFGQAGSGNHQVQGLRLAVREIEKAVQAAIRQNKSVQSYIKTGYYCLAGADLAEDYAMLHEAMEKLGFSQSVVVKNDTMAALRAGLSRSWGAVVICGTGFNAAGRAPNGSEIVLPGLGFISGDWGGGGDLSQEVIRLVMRAADGRSKPTLLTNLVLEALDIPSIEELLSRLYHEQIDRQRLLDLVPLMFKAAAQEDEPAKDLVIRMGTEVGLTATAIIRRLSLEREDVEVVLGGSVFKGEGTLLLETVQHFIHLDAPRAKILRPHFEPVVGAAMLALEAIGIEISTELLGCIERTLPEKLIQKISTL